MDKINLFAEALPKPVFSRVVRAIRDVGTERMADMGSYSTTFWLPLGTRPTNIVEHCVTELCAMVQPGTACIGMEWWLGRLQAGESLPFHTDRDRSLRKLTGQIAHPLWSSILYLNRFPGSPTIIYDQVLSPDGQTWIPPVPIDGKSLDAIPNHYVVFKGDLRHGVVAEGKQKPDASPAQNGKHPRLRLTLLINYWDRRPCPPNCRDYDGTIYPAIQKAGLRPKRAPRRRQLAA
jgi:hypothetical protein